jgi:Tol biopolymer transport system component
LKNDSPIVRTTDVYKMDADGSGKTRLTPLDSDNEHPENSPAWSPSGDQIAYVRQSGIHAEIYVMKADGSEPTLATRVKA